LIFLLFLVYSSLRIHLCSSAYAHSTLLGPFSDRSFILFRAWQYLSYPSMERDSSIDCPHSDQLNCPIINKNINKIFENFNDLFMGIIFVDALSCQTRWGDFILFDVFKSYILFLLQKSVNVIEKFFSPKYFNCNESMISLNHDFLLF
jgi:hypothetical protein